MYQGLRYAHKKLNFACKKFIFGKCLLEYKVRFAVEKKSSSNFTITWKNVVAAIKKIIIKQPQKLILKLKGNCMTSIFPYT